MINSDTIQNIWSIANYRLCTQISLGIFDSFGPSQSNMRLKHAIRRFREIILNCFSGKQRERLAEAIDNRITPFFAKS